MTRKIVSVITHNVSSGMLNSTIPYQCYDTVGWVIWPVKSSPKWHNVSSVTLNTIIPYSVQVFIGWREAEHSWRCSQTQCQNPTAERERSRSGNAFRKECLTQSATTAFNELSKCCTCRAFHKTFPKDIVGKNRDFVTKMSRSSGLAVNNVSKNVPTLASCCFNKHGLILTILCKLHQHTYNKQRSCRRDRATLRVIEYFAKSLKVIWNDTVE